MGVTEAMLKLSLEDTASSKITAFASSVTAAVSVANLAWGALSGTMGAMVGVASSVGAAMSALGSVVVDSGQKLFVLSEQSAAATNALNDTARSVGITANQMQSFMNAAGDIGISSGEASTAFRFLQMNIEQAMTGNEKAIKSFSTLGVAFKDEAGNARDAYTVMREIGGAMASMGEGSAKTATAIDFFGRSGTRMIPLLSDLDGALESADNQMRDLGQTISEEMIASAEKFRLAVGDVGDGIGALNAYLGTAMMGVFGEQAERLAAGIQDLFSKIVPELAKVTVAIKLGILDLIDKIPFDKISTGIQSLAMVAGNAIVTVIAVALRAINAIPWEEVSAKGSAVLTSLSTFAAKAWGLLSDLVRQGYTRGWDAAQAFIPMVTGLIGGLASNGVNVAKTIAIAFNTAANGAMELFQRALNFSERVSKTVAFLKDPSAENLKAIQDVTEAQDKMMAEMKAGYQSLNNEDALWWAAMQQRADSFAVNAKTTTAPIVEAIDAARGASDKVVDAVNKAAQEMGNLKGQTTLSAAQADVLKKNFYMSGESAEALAKIAARLGIDLGKVANEAGKLAKETKDAAGSAALYLSEEEKRQAAEAKAAEEKAKKAKEAKKASDETGAGGSGGGGAAGPRGGTTTTRPPIGTVISPDGTVTTTRVGGWGGYGGGRGEIGGLIPQESWQGMTNREARIEARNIAGTQSAATSQYSDLQTEFAKVQQYFNESQRRSAEKSIAAVKKQIDAGAFGGAQSKMTSLADDWKYAAEQGAEKQKETAEGVAGAKGQFGYLQKQFTEMQGVFTKAQRRSAEKAVESIRKQIETGSWAAAQDKMSSLSLDWLSMVEQIQDKEAEKSTKDVKKGAADPRRKVPVSAPTFTVGQYGPPSPVPYRGIGGDSLRGLFGGADKPTIRASEWMGGVGIGGGSGKPRIRADQWIGSDVPTPSTFSSDIGKYGQPTPGFQMGQTDPKPADVNIDGEKVGQLILKRYKSGAWTLPKSAVKDSR